MLAAPRTDPGERNYRTAAGAQPRHHRRRRLQHRLDQRLRLNIAKDGSSLAEVNREAPNTAGWQDAGLAQQEMLSAVSTTWKWRARAETAGTTVNVGNLAIAVLQLEATPAASGRRRYMALAA